MADDPIRLGAAALNNLIGESGSHIATDDFGVQRGNVRHWLGDQSLAQSSRFVLGATYSGSLPQFNGFYVDKSGDITGIDGKCAEIDVQYAKIDPLWSNVPTRTHDLQLVNINPAELGGGFGGLYSTFVQMVVPIPHPVISYKYAASSYPSSLGTYGTPANAPTVANYVFKVQAHNFSNPSIDIEQQTVTASGVLIVFHADGTCTRTTITTTATVTGIFVNDAVGLIDIVHVNFVPDPAGWLCLKEDVINTGNGAIYLIEQQWKRNMIFSGTTKGNWWTGRQIICS